MFISLYGEDGTGKTETSIGISKILPNSYILKSTTTRENRDNNQDYNYISKAEFEDKIENEDFIEWAMFNNEYYGLEKSEIENNIDKYFLIYIGEAYGIYNFNKYLEKKYPKKERIKILMNIPKNIVIENLKENNYSEEYIQKRIGRSTVLGDAKKLNIEADLTITKLDKNTVNKVVDFIFSARKEKVMIVKIKTIKSLLEEFGYDNTKHIIPCQTSFPLVMEDDIPKNRLVKVFWEEKDTVFRIDDKVTWQISPDMIEDMYLTKDTKEKE